MTNDLGGIDWQAIHGRESYVAAGECWRECGSYCCTTSHPDFSFRFIRPGQVQLPLCPAEYQHLRARGALPDERPSAASRLAVELEPGREAAVYMVRCDRGGRCDHPALRPLICKIYPYYPLPRPEGGLERLVPGSVFDAARQALDGHQACPVMARDDPGVRQEAARALEALARHPHLIFYLRAGWGIMELMQAKLAAEHSPLLELPPAEFFRRWETLYMTGRLTPGHEVAELCRREYAAVAAAWGDFPLE
jgi:hypothetical protein